MNNLIKFPILSLLISTTITMPMEKRSTEPNGCFIGDLDKTKVLNSLYKASRPLGMGILHFQPNDSLTQEEATKILQSGYIDYLNGRVMKVDLSGDYLNTFLYNRDNGKDAAEKVIENLRNPKTTDEAEDIENMEEKLKDVDPMALLLRMFMDNVKK